MYDSSLDQSDGWIACRDRLPAVGIVVETAIIEHGIRNRQLLHRGGDNGRLWFGDDGLYVYYEPTHWRSIR